MLFTDMLEPQTDLSYPDGYRHDAALDAFRKRLKSARYFVFDEQAVAMAASVAQSKPSSIVTCLPFVRLPAPIVWIEFSNQHVRQAMAALGSPNIRPEVYEVDIERTGFLLSEESGCIKMDYVHKDRVGSKTYADMAPVQGVFDPSSDNLAAKVISAFAASAKLSDTELELHGSTGRVAKYIKDLRDPEQAAAKEEISARFGFAPHPDFERLRQSLALFMPKDKIRNVELMQMEDMFRMFSNVVLPALILINSRNAVDREFVEAPARLNKQRAKKKKPPIEGYELVKMHLSPTKKRLYQNTGRSLSQVSGAMVIGHFKVRKTGIWWWNPHWRGSHAMTGTEKVFVVTS